jgi:hypothetical protein
MGILEVNPVLAEAEEADDELMLPEGATSLDVMQAIYRNPKQPFVRRMRAAAAALAYEHPKLSASYAVDGSRNFAEEMKAISRRSGRGNVLDASANYRQIEASPQPTPQLDADGKIPITPGFRRRM